jgi:hypothetical protein
MPSILWSIFKQNRHLLHDLPALGAAVIQEWAKSKYGVCLLLMVVPHTFGGYLNFNTHLHILVSAGGLNESEGRWVAPLVLDQTELMKMWCYAVIAYLREALKAHVLNSDRDEAEVANILTTQYKRPRWIIHIHRSMSKRHFLAYAARYARRLPIAQKRILSVSDQEVVFSTKDKRRKEWVTTKRSKVEFVADLSEHIPDRYLHAIRHFGLLAPRAKAKTFPATFVLLGQQPSPRPARLSWTDSLKRYFGVDPLIDSRGQRMHWTRRLGPSMLPVPT